MTTANRVALNTTVQYSRLIINLVIALVSVRIILNALGADDYGIYDVVGGVIALLGFLNSSLSQTSIRFLSVTLGAKDIDNLRETFNNCFWLHLVIAIAMALGLEIVGLFIFDGALNIPSERIHAAKIVFQCMGISTFLQIAVTPFQALIISHERFIYTSLISILDSILKLFIAFCLLYTNSDKLVLYGILMAIVTFLNTILYICYVFVHYHNEVYISNPSISGIKKQSGFAGWTILDILGSLLNRQGYAIMLNIFFGPATNATFAVSRQVEGQIYGVSAAVLDTMKPQIMKSYGANDQNRMFRLSMSAGKFGFTLMSFVCIPLLVFTPELLLIWLKSVPVGAVSFTRLLVGACMMSQITQGLMYASQATGNIKWFSIIVSGTRMLALPASLILCICGCPAYLSMVAFFVFESLGSLSRVLVMSKVQGLPLGMFWKDVILKVVPPFVLSIVICSILKLLFPGTLALVCTSIVAIMVYAIMSFFWGLTKEEKNVVTDIFKSFIKKVYA